MSPRRSVLVPPPFRSVADVLDGLSKLELQFCDQRDRRGVFVSAYLLITMTLHDWIQWQRFLENDLVACYIVAFANKYRQALENYEADARAAVPQAWLQSFEASIAGESSIIQDLLLGINAHINHDLPHAVLESGLNVRCDRSYRDHVAINEALKVATPLVRQRIAALHRRRFVVVNWLSGWAIDHAVANCFARIRKNSWQRALALDAATDPQQRVLLEHRIDQDAAANGRAILAHRHDPLKCLAALQATSRGDERAARTPYHELSFA